MNMEKSKNKPPITPHPWSTPGWGVFGSLSLHQNRLLDYYIVSLKTRLWKSFNCSFSELFLLSLVLLNPGSCANTLKSQNSKRQEFEVRKSLLIEKAPTEKVGDLPLLQIHFAHWLRIFKELGETGMHKY